MSTTTTTTTTEKESDGTVDDLSTVTVTVEAYKDLLIKQKFRSKFLCSYVAPPRLISLIGFISVVLYGYGVTIFNKTSVTSGEWGAGGGALENIPILDRHALFFTVLVLSYLILGLYILWLITFFRKIKEDKKTENGGSSSTSSISLNDSSTSKPKLKWFLRRRHEVLAASVCLGMSMSLGAVTLMITFFVTYKSFMLMIPYLVWISYLLVFTVSYLFFLNNKTPSVV